MQAHSEVSEAGYARCAFLRRTGPVARRSRSFSSGREPKAWDSVALSCWAWCEGTRAALVRTRCEAIKGPSWELLACL